MEVTESQLAAALEGSALIVHPVDSPGDTVQVDVDNPDAFAETLYATLARMAALREPGGVRVTRKQLEDTLAEFCAVTGDGRVAFTSDSGTVADVARALHGQLAAFNAARCDLEGTGDAPAPFSDPELAVTARIIAELEAIDMPALHGTSSGPVWRILQHAAGRLGYVICTED